MRNFVFQIKLTSITIIENGFVEEIEGNNLLSVSLVYPNPTVQSPTTVINLKLKDEKSFDATATPLKNRIIYKGEIIGESGIDVELSAIEKPDKIGKILFQAFGTSVIGAVGLITGTGAIALVTAAAKKTLESVFKLAKPKEKIHVIGKGAMPLDIDTPEGDFAVQLSVPEEVILKQHFINEKGQKAIKTVTLPEGYNNAMVVFDIKKFLIDSKNKT